jgi:hypothetical protein
MTEDLLQNLADSLQRIREEREAEEGWWVFVCHPSIEPRIRLLVPHANIKPNKWCPVDVVYKLDQRQIIQVPTWL